MILITHEREIAEYGTRIVNFLDGLIVSDVANKSRRIAGHERHESAARIA